MEESQPSSQSQSPTPSQEADITLTGKKAPSASKARPTQEDKQTTESRDRDKQKGRVPRSGGQGSTPSQNLVLQMFSHMRTQRRLEQEKNARLARDERRRQKLRKGSPTRTFSDSSSLYHFGGYWTHCRILRSQKLAGAEEGQSDDGLQETNGIEARPGSEVATSPGLGHDWKADKSRDEVGDASEQSGDLDGEQTSPLASPRQRYIRVNISKTPSSGKSNRRDVTSEPEDTGDSGSNSEARSPDGGNYKNKPTHMLKGPGRVQIHFSQLQPPSRRRTRPGQQYSYQWDSMAAGTLTSSPKPALITMDGNML